MLNLRRARIEHEAANAASRETGGANTNAVERGANTGAAFERTRPRTRLPNSGLWSSDLENAIARTRERRERNEELLRDIWGEEDTDDGPPSHVARAPRTRVDGLGDRDRSLSPEGDDAWDTLLTTVTPDPQPPSVSSSFASFLSSVAGRTPANDSSNTSMTGREPGAEESAVEQPCDSDEEGDPVRFDVDMDDDTSAQPNTYADVVRNAGYTMPSGVRTRTAPVGRPGSGSGTGAARRPRVRIERVRNGHIYASSNEPATDDLILQLVGGLGGMQHIVRNLVSREDIPNDWWVDAGLSRALPRDGSGDEEGANN
ncbi:hypothetical protein GE09DRAFT_678056 [Coniochaeta sp. 2T2.1]|nr:hypothetical protein GE09DRAFT_678056 [Coniochaeta sp. 2T2.1]